MSCLCRLPRVAVAAEMVGVEARQVCGWIDAAKRMARSAEGLGIRRARDDVESKSTSLAPRGEAAGL